jgi:antitoxin YefM
MQTISYSNLTENPSELIQKISDNHEAICLELPNSFRAIVLSEEDYNSMIETLYLLSNPVNAEKLLTAVNRLSNDAIAWDKAKSDLEP